MQVNFVDPTQEWRIKRTWFVQVEGIKVTLKARGGRAGHPEHAGLSGAGHGAEKAV